MNHDPMLLWDESKGMTYTGEKKGPPPKIEGSPILSDFLNEVRTYFEQKFLNLAEKPQKE